MIDTDGLYNDDATTLAGRLRVAQRGVCRAEPFDGAKHVALIGLSAALADGAAEADIETQFAAVMA